MATSRKLTGIKIRYYRQKAKMSLTTLAGRIGIDKQYLSDIELGKVNICSDYLDTIIPHLNITTHEFHFSGIPDPVNSGLLKIPLTELQTSPVPIPSGNFKL